MDDTNTTIDPNSYSAQNDQNLNNSSTDNNSAIQDDPTAVTAANQGNPGQTAVPGDFTFGTDYGDVDIDSDTGLVMPDDGIQDTTNAPDIGEDITNKEGTGTAGNIGDDDTGYDTTGRLGPV